MGTSTALPRSPPKPQPRTKTTSSPENPKLDTDLGEKRMTATNLTTRPELRGEGGGSDQGDRTNPETWQTRSLYTWQPRSPHAFSPLKKSQRTKAMTEPAKETPETGSDRQGRKGKRRALYLFTASPELHSYQHRAPIHQNKWPDPPRHCTTEVLCLLCLLCLLPCCAVALPWRRRGASK